MKRARAIVAACETCVDYAYANGLLYKHGQQYRHLGNDRVRCPGQEDDDTDDVADPIGLPAFVEGHRPKTVDMTLGDLFDEFTVTVKRR